jgi:hypothetical protein
MPELLPLGNYRRLAPGRHSSPGLKAWGFLPSSYKKLQNLINILTQDLTRLFLITMNLHRKQKTLCQSVGKPSLFLTGTLRYDVGRNEVSHIDP